MNWLRALAARRHFAKHERRARADRDSVLAATQVEPRERTPLGDSPDLHDDISPHDLPRGSAARRTLERAERESAVAAQESAAAGQRGAGR